MASKLSLEDFAANLNITTFWQEFTFHQTRFRPRPAEQVELADGIVKFGSFAIIFQMKERTQETNDPEVERRWFQRKVLRKAKDQIKSTLSYLSKNSNITIDNDRGHSITLDFSNVSIVRKIILFKGGRHLPRYCFMKKRIVSAEAKFIHILEIEDYFGIIEKLRVPYDVIEYLEYREKIISFSKGDLICDEADIMAGFLSDMEMPQPNSKEKLRNFVQDIQSFDISGIIRNLHDHIVVAGADTSYYRILEQFACVPRSIWREFKTRLVICIDACKARQARMPFIVGFPQTDCTFMIASMDPEWPVLGEGGTTLRLAALNMFTEAAKYHLKTRVGVGLLISLEDQYFNLDWCQIDRAWVYNSKLESIISDIGLFKTTKSQSINKFFFR
ncbi:MAG: hypothetical protein JNK46_03045 [Methylobacteriaceae bacterium]|nr:hypothetical protein [Methylobacteriaceae bacterium]